VWHWGDVTPGLLEALRNECGVAPETVRLDTLPPLSEGLVRRAHACGERGIDLTPREWHEIEQNKAMRRRLVGASAGLVVVWLAAVLALSVVGVIQEQQTRRLNAKIRQLEGPAEEAQAIERKVEELLDYSDRTQSALECLRVISERLPQGVDLTSFAYKKSRELALRGITSPTSANLVYKFFEDIEQSPLFPRYSGQKINTSGSRGRQRTQFSVVLHFTETDEEEQP
jgi:Tfp pilus assembly protein PilN